MKPKTFKLPVSSPLHKPIIHIAEKPFYNNLKILFPPKTTSKVSVPRNSLLHDKFIPVLNYVNPKSRLGDESISRIIKRKNHTGY